MEQLSKYEYKVTKDENVRVEVVPFGGTTAANVVASLDGGQNFETLFSRKMGKTRLLQSSGSDRFRSFVTRSPGEPISELDMRNVGKTYLIRMED